MRLTAISNYKGLRRERLTELCKGLQLVVCAPSSPAGVLQAHIRRRCIRTGEGSLCTARLQVRSGIIAVVGRTAPEYHSVLSSDGVRPLCSASPIQRISQPFPTSYPTIPGPSPGRSPAPPPKLS